MASPEEINIPHLPPMVMVDRIVSVSGPTTITRFFIRADNVFCSNGYFREPGLIENMAQTAAAGAGLKPGIEPGKAPVGFLGGIRGLKITELPPAGSEIKTHITVEHEIMNATVARGKVFFEGRLIAECELKIFLRDKIK